MSENAQRPLISIIVPSFNHGRFIRECLDSILDQDYRPLEILVMDGGSKDDTVAVLKEYAHVPEVRWWSEPDRGPADAVNKGLAKASGDIIGIQSSDDYYLPGALSRVAAEFVARPDVGLVYGDSRNVNLDGSTRSRTSRPPHTNAMCIAMCVCIPQSSAFFRTTLGRELGGWRLDVHTADWEFWLRMMFRTQVVKVDAELSAWRMYAGQRTDQRRKVFDAYRRMIDESPDIQGAGWQTRLAALASKQLIGISFDRGGPWRKLRYLLAATALYPPLWPQVPRKLAMLPKIREIWPRRHPNPQKDSAP